MDRRFYGLDCQIDEHAVYFVLIELEWVFDSILFRLWLLLRWMEYVWGDIENCQVHSASIWLSLHLRKEYCDLLCGFKLYLQWV